MQNGLSSAEAEAKLKADGPNALEATRKHSRFGEFVRATLNPLIVVLVAAGVVSALLGGVADALIIGAIVLMSATIDYWQSFRSEQAVRRLQARVAPTATVLRDGVWREVPRAQIVVGDVVRLSAGDLVPADARLLESSDLHVQQAALTGESLPAEKAASSAAPPAIGPDSPNLVFLGTSVVSGTAIAVVCATGQRTAFGDIVARLSARPEPTEFERGMRRFGMLILRAVVALVVFILAVNLGLGRDLFTSLLFSVAVAVGLTPEFLPMILSVTLAQGAIRMARQKVIVKHLPAIQNLGSIDVLCSDKTGTLTAGTMSVDASVDPFGDPAPKPLFLAHLNSRFETGIKSPLDAAILERSVAGAESYVKTDEIPFDFERRRLSVVVKSDQGQFLLITKGAPESVLAVCSSREIDGAVHHLDDSLRERSLQTFRNMSERGFRVLAVAYKAVETPLGHTPADEDRLTLVGFVSFADHPLDGVAESIIALKRDVVGFLGDGINDAPSLHRADVGISVAGAVDVAREASDIVLLERRLDVLHAGIVAGRKCFGNILKYVFMGTSSNFGNMFSLAGAALVLPFLPMLPTQILLNNFLYDFAQITIPGDRTDPAFVQKPQRWNLRLIRNFMLIVGPVSSAFDFLTFFVLLRVFHFGEELFHTGWFVESLATQTLVLLVIRTAGRPWKNRPSPALFAATLLVTAIGIALPYSPVAAPLGLAPLPAAFFLYLVLALGAYLTLVEIVKYRVMRQLRSDGSSPEQESRLLLRRA